MSIAIGLTLFFVSLLGIVFLVVRRVGELKTLPESAEEQQWREAWKAKVLDVRNRLPFGSREEILRTVLSQTSALASKAERKSSEWLEQLRRKSERRQAQFSQDYWKRLKRAKKGDPERPA